MLLTNVCDRVSNELAVRGICGFARDESRQMSAIVRTDLLLRAYKRGRPCLVYLTNYLLVTYGFGT